MPPSKPKRDKSGIGCIRKVLTLGILSLAAFYGIRSYNPVKPLPDNTPVMQQTHQVQFTQTLQATYAPTSTTAMTSTPDVPMQSSSPTWFPILTPTDTPNFIPSQTQTYTPTATNTFTPLNTPTIIPTANGRPQTTAEFEVWLQQKQSEMQALFAPTSAGMFGEEVSGVAYKMNTPENVVALTFDACTSSSGYDSELIEYLIRNNIPSTLFLNAHWIQGHPSEAQYLASNPIFQIESHGYDHKPLSINGQSIYGIQGTESISEVVAEIERGVYAIFELTGIFPSLFRSGTAYYDEASIQILSQLGYTAVNFDVLSGDAVAGTPTETIASNILSAKPGSIIIMHMNHPEWNTYEALQLAIPELQQMGFSFVKLQDNNLIYR